MRIVLEIVVIAEHHPAAIVTANKDADQP